MIIQNEQERKILRDGGRKLAAVLARLAEAAVPGAKTADLDALAERLIRKAGGAPSFKGYRADDAEPYPATLCISINDHVVHGIPDERALNKGDIVGLDIGMVYKGFYTDTATTIIVGGGTNKLLDATKKSLDIAISKTKAGVCVGDIGHAVQNFLESKGFGVVRELVGHGVGRAVHEEPEIPNWGKLGTGAVLHEGEVIALEPMATEGSPAVKLLKDGWTWATRDGSRAAHFEHTLIVTKSGAEVLTRIE